MSGSNKDTSITLLESVAVLDLLKKLTRTAEVTNKKVILMVDK